jgi:hypothetical protein
MNESHESEELLARLRAADPASRAVAPAPNWIDDLTEATMSTSTDENRTRRTWLIAAAAAVVVAAIGLGGIAALGGNDNGDPAAKNPAAVFELTAPGHQDARCMMVTPKTLSRFDSAFEATVTSLDGREATLKIEKWYAGSAAAKQSTQAHLTSATQSMTELVGSVKFKEGGRYLITATGSEMTSCGFSAPWTQGLADQYAAAFDS